jgi:hypothetical protein
VPVRRDTPLRPPHPASRRRRRYRRRLFRRPRARGSQAAAPPSDCSCDRCCERSAPTRPAASFLARRLGAIITAAADRFRYDGLYLTVYDRSGRLIFSMANGTRMATGSDGVALRRLQGCNPIENLGVFVPPPCPVTPVAMAR